MEYLSEQTIFMLISSGNYNKAALLITKFFKNLSNALKGLNTMNDSFSKHYMSISDFILSLLLEYPRNNFVLTYSDYLYDVSKLLNCPDIEISTRVDRYLEMIQSVPIINANSREEVLLRFIRDRYNFGKKMTHHDHDHNLRMLYHDNINFLEKQLSNCQRELSTSIQFNNEPSIIEKDVEDELGFDVRIEQLENKNSELMKRNDMLEEYLKEREKELENKLSETIEHNNKNENIHLIKIKELEEQNLVLSNSLQMGEKEIESLKLKESSMGDMNPRDFDFYNDILGKLVEYREKEYLDEKIGKKSEIEPGEFEKLKDGLMTRFIEKFLQDSKKEIDILRNIGKMDSIQVEYEKELNKLIKLKSYLQNQSEVILSSDKIKAQLLREKEAENEKKEKKINELIERIRGLESELEKNENIMEDHKKDHEFYRTRYEKCLAYNQELEDRINKLENKEGMGDDPNGEQEKIVEKEEISQDIPTAEETRFEKRKYSSIEDSEDDEQKNKIMKTLYEYNKSTNEKNEDQIISELKSSIEMLKKDKSNIFQSNQQLLNEKDEEIESLNDNLRKLKLIKERNEKELAKLNEKYTSIVGENESLSNINHELNDSKREYEKLQEKITEYDEKLKTAKSDTFSSLDYMIYMIEEFGIGDLQSFMNSINDEFKVIQVENIEDLIEYYKLKNLECLEELGNIIKSFGCKNLIQVTELIDDIIRIFKIETVRELIDILKDFLKNMDCANVPEVAKLINDIVKSFKIGKIKELINISNDINSYLKIMGCENVPEATEIINDIIKSFKMRKMEELMNISADINSYLETMGCENVQEANKLLNDIIEVFKIKNGKELMEMSLDIFELLEKFSELYDIQSPFHIDTFILRMENLEKSRIRCNEFVKSLFGIDDLDKCEKMRSRLFNIFKMDNLQDLGEFIDQGNSDGRKKRKRTFSY